RFSRRQAAELGHQHTPAPEASAFWLLSAARRAVLLLCCLHPLTVASPPLLSVEGRRGCARPGHIVVHRVRDWQDRDSSHTLVVEGDWLLPGPVTDACLADT